MLVNGDEIFGGSGDGRKFEPLPVIRAERTSAGSPDATRVFVISSEEGIHGHAPGTSTPAGGALFAAEISIGRAFVDSEVAGEVGRKDAIPDQAHIGVHLVRSREGHD